jgi:hypothetical protein
MSGKTESRKRGRQNVDSPEHLGQHSDDAPQSLLDLMRKVTEETRVEIAEAVTRELKEKQPD